MKLIEAWQLSLPPYREVVFKSIAEERGRMWWGSFGRDRLGKEGTNGVELTKRALMIAKFDKLIVAVFNVLAAVIPFTTLFFGSPTFGLTSSISLSLTITFGFMALYAIQTLSSFVSAESSAVLSTLPLAKGDFSLIMLFSFIRSVDYMAVGSISSQVAFVAYLTASPLATLLMFAASLTNAVLAVTVALWFSRMFQKNLLQGGRSKGRTVLRLAFLLMWGSLLMGVGFLFSVPWHIVPVLERTMLGLDQISNLFLCLFHPFSAGITIANLVYPSATFITTLTASAAMVGYIVIAGAAGKWVLGTVKRISQGDYAKIARVATKDFSIKTRNPLLGYVMKDLKVSSRNPATAFFFALPILETVIVSLLMTNFEVLRASTILVTTFMGGIFALLMPLALLNAEGMGLEYTKTLPVRANRIITSKALISTATYAPVPLALLSMALLKQLTSPLILFIPFFTILAIASASIFEIKLFLGSATEGRIAALVHDLKKLITGIMTLLIPEAVYVMVYLISFDHFLAVLVTGGAAISELAIALYLLKRS